MNQTQNAEYSCIQQRQLSHSPHTHPMSPLPPATTPTPLFAHVFLLENASDMLLEPKSEKLFVFKIVDFHTIEDVPKQATLSLCFLFVSLQFYLQPVYCFLSYETLCATKT